MKYLIILCLIFSCHKNNISVTPVISLSDSCITLIYQNNTSADVLLNRKVSIISNQKTYISSSAIEGLEETNPYVRPIRLLDIAPYDLEYDKITKDNMPYLLNNGRYLNSIIRDSDPYTFIKKGKKTIKKYKIFGYKKEDKLTIVLKNENSSKIKEFENYKLYNDTIEIKDFKLN